MLALSIVTPHGTNIASGKKTLEVRSWCPPTLPVRDLLIVENTVFLSRDMPCDPGGRVVAIVDIEEVHEWRSDEVAAACSSGWEPGYWAWSLSNVRLIKNDLVVPAKRKLYNVDVESAGIRLDACQASPECMTNSSPAQASMLSDALPSPGGRLYQGVFTGRRGEDDAIQWRGGAGL